MQQNSSNQNLHQKSVYFQHQGHDLLCGLHTINNFLGYKRHDEESMNQICYTLAEGKKFFNPHKHLFFRGDYDVNILMYALSNEKYQVKWHDKRKNIDKQDLFNLQGLLLNIKIDKWYNKICCCNSSRHWLCIKKIINNQKQSNIQFIYVLLDSQEEKPKFLFLQEVLRYIERLQANEGQVLKIFKQKNQ